MKYLKYKEDLLTDKEFDTFMMYKNRMKEFKVSLD